MVEDARQAIHFWANAFQEGASLPVSQSKAKVDCSSNIVAVQVAADCTQTNLQAVGATGGLGVEHRP